MFKPGEVLVDIVNAPVIVSPLFSTNAVNCADPETRPDGILLIEPNVICEEPETKPEGTPVIPLNVICPEPDTTVIPLKNEPECIVVPANTCEDPDTVPTGNAETTCAELDKTFSAFNLDLIPDE